MTAIPTPTDLSQLLNIKSYASSLAGYVTQELASFTAAANPSAVSEKAKIQKELASFAATASYSIPSGVTALTGLETFTTVPDAVALALLPLAVPVWLTPAAWNKMLSTTLLFLS